MAKYDVNLIVELVLEGYGYIEIKHIVGCSRSLYGEIKQAIRYGGKGWKKFLDDSRAKKWIRHKSNPVLIKRKNEVSRKYHRANLHKSSQDAKIRYVKVIRPAIYKETSSERLIRLEKCRLKNITYKARIKNDPKKSKERLARERLRSRIRRLNMTDKEKQIYNESQRVRQKLRYSIRKKRV